MFFQHVYDKSLAQGSYVIGCQATGNAIVIDAKRDIDTYLKIAKENNFKITHLTETHIHADFLSGTRELAAVTGAEVLLSDEGGPDWQYEFPHTGLKDGDIIRIGNLSLEVIHTPGHTPESISFLLRDHPASDEPVMIFTGDFVFVGDIGRPDLLEKAAGLEGTKEEGASQMFQSLKKFRGLPPHIQVWPGHGAGSACGKALGAVPSSTVGYELIQNWAFKYNKAEEFSNELLAGQPEPPKYFAVMKKLNKVNRPLLTEVPQLKKLGREEFLSLYNKGIKIIDTREKSEFAKAHIPGSISISNNKSFTNWAGWFINYDEDFLLVVNEEETEMVTRKLMRIGLDKIAGYISSIEETGITLQSNETIDIEEFRKLKNREDVDVFDVRNSSEYENGNIEGVKHLFLGTLPDNLDKIDPSKEIIVHCQTGARSSIAQSILKAHGFKNVKNYLGGYSEWKKNHSS